MGDETERLDAVEWAEREIACYQAHADQGKSLALSPTSCGQQAAWLRTLLETVDASRDEPTEADPAKAWAEQARFNLTEVLDVNDLALALAEVRQRGSAHWARMVYDSHEKLRALVGGRSAVGERCSCGHTLASHSYWDSEDEHLSCNVGDCGCEGYAVGGRSAAPTEREAQAIYDDVHSEMSTAFGWSDDDRDDVRDWRHDLVTRIIALTQPSQSAAPTREQVQTHFCASGRHSVCRGVVLPTEALCQCSCHGGDLQAVVHPLEAEIGAVVWQGIGRLVADVQDAGHDVPEAEALARSEQLCGDLVALLSRSAAGDDDHGVRLVHAPGCDGCLQVARVLVGKRSEAGGGRQKGESTNG